MSTPKGQPKPRHKAGVVEAARVLYVLGGLPVVEIAFKLRVPERTVASWRDRDNWDVERAKEKTIQAATTAGINLVLAHKQGNLVSELERLLIEQLAAARDIDPKLNALINDIEAIARDKNDSRALTSAFWALTRKHGLHMDMVKAVAALVESVARLREANKDTEGMCPALTGHGPISPNCPLLKGDRDDEDLPGQPS